MEPAEVKSPVAAKSPTAGQDLADASGMTPPTSQAIHELKNYFPFSSARPFPTKRSFHRACSVRRDSFIQENRAIGVFTSGGDASGMGRAR